MNQHITVRIFVTLGEKVLLSRVKGETHHYELPGWAVSFGYTPEEILKKGLAEDMNLISKIRYSITDVVAQVDEKQKNVQHIVLLYDVPLKESNVSTLHPVPVRGGFIWVELQDLHQYKLTKLTQQILSRRINGGATDQKKQVKMTAAVKHTTKQKEVVVYSDGGSRGNPGPSAAGFAIFDKNNALLFEGGKYLGITTNNQAEYQAVMLGLEKALELGARHVDFRMDSLLVVNQMAGVYKVRNRDLWPIYKRINDLVNKFEHVKFSHVRREFNKEADALVNKVLDEHK